MRTLTIDNFGPVKHTYLELDNMVDIVIGPQASGKSTIAKVIYFCRKTRDYLIDYLMDSQNFTNTHPNELYVNFLKYVRRTFMGFFGTTKHVEKFNIEYYFNKETNTFIKITLDNEGFAKITFSANLNATIKELIQEAHQIHQETLKVQNLTFLERFNKDSQIREIAYKHFTEIVHSLFCDNQAIVYIPAGRSVLSTFSEQLYDVNVTMMDTTMQEFIGLIRTTRSKFNNKLDDIVANYTKTVKGQINNYDVSLAISIIAKILRGNYVFDKDGEKIYYDTDKWIKLMFASSGQQESLWSLMLMFTFILENRSAFIVLEEPEAHLFPEAQKYIVELIALFCNSTNSSVFLTTHSPYVLTSFNLLIHSYRVENHPKLSNEKNKIIARDCRLNPSKTNAYKIASELQNNLNSIIENETGLIDAYEIDKVSQIIAEDTEKLIDLEIKYDL